MPVPGPMPISVTLQATWKVPNLLTLIRTSPFCQKMLPTAAVTLCPRLKTLPKNWVNGESPPKAILWFMMIKLLPLALPGFGGC